MTIITIIALAVGLWFLARRIDAMESRTLARIAEAQQESGIEASITRRYLGKLTGDPGLQETPTIDAGSF